MHCIHVSGSLRRKAINVSHHESSRGLKALGAHDNQRESLFTVLKKTLINSFTAFIGRSTCLFKAMDLESAAVDILKF